MDQAIQSAQPCTRFSVEIVHGRTTMIGFAPRIGFQKHERNPYHCGFFLDIYGGRLLGQDTRDDLINEHHCRYVNIPFYSPEIPVGSIVTAIHHATTREIEFQVNGTSFGIAYRNIPYDDLFAAADLLEVDAALRFVEDP
jgi:hypothetical protein